MPVLAIRDDDLPGRAILSDALAGLAPGAPVVVMIHGFRYSPSDPRHDPHRHILAVVPEAQHWGAVSWPRRVGLDEEQGLGIAWGWDAMGSIWCAHRRAATSGEALACFIAALRRLDPDRPVHIIAHSLGVRVALAALSHLREGAVQRVIMLAAATSLRESLIAWASPAGQTAEFINVVGRENCLFDLLLLAALPHQGRRLGRGFVGAENWLDLSLDDHTTLVALGRLGWKVAPARATICHWSSYLRPGIWRLYKALLLHSPQIPLARIRAALTAVAHQDGHRSPALDSCEGHGAPAVDEGLRPSTCATRDRARPTTGLATTEQAQGRGKASGERLVRTGRSQGATVIAALLGCAGLGLLVYTAACSGCATG
jgi:pimeloyl-ACP methyl ester carboxylesterase